MLSFFRRKMKLILWILVIVVIVTFIPWGVGVRLRSRSAGGGAAGELFGKKVSRAEFEDACDAVRTFHALFRGKVTLTQQQVKDQAWERLIMLHEARRAGIHVPDIEVAQTIQNQFGRGGAFDQAMYERILMFSGVTPSAYENWVRETLMIGRLQQLVRTGNWMPDSELERQYQEQESKLTIKYAVYKTDQMLQSVSIPEEELKKYYEDHQADYTTPEKMTVRYISIPWSVPPKPKVADEEIKEYYDAHPEEFSHGKRLHARNILIKIEGKDRAKAEADARARAEDVEARLKKGKSFASMVKKYSQDEKTKDKGGDMGFVSASEMAKALSDAAFALKVGQFTAPVKTARGYEIIQAEGVQEPGTKPLDEVRDKIRSKLEREKETRAAEEAKSAAYAKAVDISLALVDNPDAAAAAKKFSVQIKEAGPFAENENVKELGPGPGSLFAKTAFSTEVGAFSDIVEIPGKEYCIILPKQRIEQATIPFEQAREKILKKLREESAKKEAHETAEAKRAEVEKLMKEKKLDFQAACAELSIPLTESKPFTAKGPIPGLGYEPKIASEATLLKLNTVSKVIDIRTGSCFFSVVKREEPPKQDMAKKLESFRKRVSARQASIAMQEWNRWVHEQAKLVDHTSGAPEGDSSGGEQDD